MEAHAPAPDADTAASAHHAPTLGRKALALASLGALGVVYGDIGTSPLYALKECLAWHPKGEFSPHAVEPTIANTLGVLSLMFWSLVLVICVKYIIFVLRADNKGEGGILALAALVTGSDGKRVRGKRLAIPILLGLFGTGLLFGDGVITPAISVLGAMEGLSEQSPALTDFIVPVTIAILVGLFFVQRYGTGRIGFAFVPIIMVWFFAIGAIGLRWILIEPHETPSRVDRACASRPDARLHDCRGLRARTSRRPGELERARARRRDDERFRDRRRPAHAPFALRSLLRPHARQPVRRLRLRIHPDARI
jgi:KUP system potassium uptake protein